MEQQGKLVRRFDECISNLHTALNSVHATESSVQPIKHSLIDRLLSVLSSSLPVISCEQQKSPHHIATETLLHCFDYSNLHLYSLGQRQKTSRVIPAIEEISDFDSIQLQHLIFISGGVSYPDYLTSTYSYNIHTHISTQKCDMLVPKNRHTLAVLNGQHIYSIGGFNHDEGTLSTCERYSLAHDSWTLLSPLNRQRAVPSVIGKSGRALYVFGGIEFCKGGDRHVDTIEVLDACEEEAAWTVMAISPIDSHIPLYVCCAIIDSLTPLDQ